MHQILDEILNSTNKRINNLETGPESNSVQIHNKRDILSIISFKQKEGKNPIITEIKPASPTQYLKDINPDDAVFIANEMEQAGAVAISVLTEPQFFHGSIENLQAVRNAVNLPILRKDFILSEKQFDEVNCDVILLIAGILGKQLSDFVDLALSKNIEPLVEIHSLEELDQTLKTNARLIGINNRNLQTMQIDIKTTLELIPLIKKHDQDHLTKHYIVSESGILYPHEKLQVLNAGADAILIGTAIIKSGNYYEKTKEFVDN